MQLSKEGKQIELHVLNRKKPWRLIDTVINQESDRVAYQKFVSHSDFFLIGHFEEKSVYPGVILVESILQGIEIFFQTKAEELRNLKSKFHKIVEPGSIITFSITKHILSSRRIKFSAVASNERNEQCVTFSCIRTLKG
ncbi:hotdog family protein [Virgibacillus senegalensis]|uniref:hypothetical protein n=1 Tax=Virgibacillus senegalensis TaxID=1499679 RepID=UPI00069EE3E0|nr:hypothetical protein [Virgibacillus senegalensis]